MFALVCFLITLEGSNVQERNDEFLSEIVCHIQTDEDDDTDNCCFIGGALEFSGDGIGVVHDISEVYVNYVVIYNVMTRFTNTFDDKETIAMLVKQRLE